ADEFLADDVAAALANIEADEFLFAEVRAPGSILGTAEFRTSAGRDLSITVEEARDDRHVVTLRGKNTPFYAAKAFIDRIFMDPAAFLPTPEPAEEEAAEETG